MQTEAGEGLARILRRKEMERRAGEGLFFWGVGNAPARAIPALAKASSTVDVVFSVMKTKPKVIDVTPPMVLAWRNYVDAEGAVRLIPPHVLVTSRATRRNCHYALVCQSETSLNLADQGPFDPNAFRNFGAGRAVGASQVTALLERCAPDGASAYRVVMRACLTGGFWVKLVDPIVLGSEARGALESDPCDEDGWLRTVSFVHSAGRSVKAATHEHQPTLFPV